MLISISSGNGTNEVMRGLWHFEQWLKNRYEYEVIDKEEGGCHQCYRSILLKSSDGRLKMLEGTHLWIATSSFRPRHKRKNWYFSLKCYDELPPLDIDTNQIEYQRMKSPKNGGQHANTTASGVRAIHKSLGVSSISYDERSQHRNKAIAHQRLLEKIALHREKETIKAIQNRWRGGKEIERGNPILTFLGENFREGG